MAPIITIIVLPLLVLAMGVTYLVVAWFNPWRNHAGKDARGRRLACLLVGVLLVAIVLALWGDRMIVSRPPAPGEIGHVEFRFMPRLVHYYDSCPGPGPC